MRNATNLAWIDLEMTGLDPERDVILQAALIVTDKDLQPLDEYACDVWQPESSLERMSPFVRDMHDKNGLLARVRASRVDQREAQRQLMARISALCDFPAVLCGSSIWVDRTFLDRHMPGLAGYLHYRMVDVTSVKLLVDRWFGPQAVFQKPGVGEHDALVDIRNSIAELRHYRKLLQPDRT
ncbi:MAG TPA: oligoribonuclease [Polyangiales bacterium]|nr:oligoribonuclease [Polyangiales bacterium]